MNRFWIPLALVAALCLAALVFALDPTLDLTAAAAFYKGANTFVGQTHLGEAVRRVVYWVPAVVAVFFVLIYLLRRAGLVRGGGPSGRAVVVVVLSFAIGPGLLANTILKNHTHRPRPFQTTEFGGTEPFRPFYATDGACKRNCSFVSGEGSAAFWTTIPALLLPPTIRAGAVAVSLVFGVLVGTLRMAFGGHYLSDTVFAALLTWAVGWLIWRAILGDRHGWSEPPPTSMREDAPLRGVRP